MEFIILVGRFFLNIAYFVMKLLPQQEKVVFISRQYDQPSIDFKLIEKEIKKQKPNTRVVMLCRTLSGGYASTFADKLKYAFHMLVQMYHLATARIAILDTYCIVVSLLRHRKSLKVIQIWHSMGTMKKFGYTTLDTKEGSSSRLAKAMRMHKNYTYVFASADAYKEHLASGFQCPVSIIKTFPLPRVDLLQSEVYRRKTRERILKVYPELKEKKVVLYCPTFRKDETSFVQALKKLEDEIKSPYCLVVKNHPLSTVKPFNDKTMLLPEFSSFETLFVADYLISDYSCIVYEAAVLNIPLFFYEYDIKDYQGERGLAIDYEKELPGLKTDQPQQIMQALSESYDMEELKAFRSKYVEPTEHATKDIVDFLWKIW